MLASPVLHCEVIEEFWTSAMYNSESKTLSFSLKIVNYIISGEDVRVVLRMSENTHDKEPYNVEILDMLDSINYLGDTSNLGKIYRKCMRKEWSFFCDAIIKVFSGKISNFDAFTTSMQNIMFMLLNDKYHNIRYIILYEMVAKL